MSSRGIRRNNSVGNLNGYKRLENFATACLIRQSSFHLKEKPIVPSDSISNVNTSTKMQLTMNSPFNMLNAGGKRALSRDLSLASIPVSPAQKKCDDIIADSPWHSRRRRRNLDVQLRPIHNVSFGTSDDEPSIQYFPAPESGHSDEELNECFYSVSLLFVSATRSCFSLQRLLMVLFS
jgi:hypothetical protein